VGTIFEGPYDWTVRPVAEVVYEREFNTVEIYSVLAGAIWKVSDDLSFDVGFREAWVNRRRLPKYALVSPSRCHCSQKPWNGRAECYAIALGAMQQPTNPSRASL